MDDELYYLNALINLRDEITEDANVSAFGDWDREVAGVRTDVFDD